MVFAAGDIHAAPNMFSPDWGENGSRFWGLTAAVRTGNLDQTLESILLAKDARVSNLDDARLLFSASLLRDVVRAGGRVWVRADVLQGWGQEVVWKSLSQITATLANTEYHVATAWQNNEPIPADRLVYNGVSGNPEASDIQKRRRYEGHLRVHRPCLRSKYLWLPGMEDELPQSKECVNCEVTQ